MSLSKMVDGLFTSKINYGLQLYGKVRTEISDPTNGDPKAIQKVQNKMARFLNSKTLKDKIPTKVLLERQTCYQSTNSTPRSRSWKSGKLKTYRVIH